ncbi:MAG: hypothetical protein U0132_21385 [Gemmatimonadaceae bacterium]
MTRTSEPTTEPVPLASAVWVDIAHPSRTWLFIRGLILLSIAVFFALGFVLMVRDAWEEQNWGLGIAAAFGVFLIWWSLGSGLLRVRVALFGRCFIQANRSGLRVLSMPDNSRFWTPLPAKPTEIRWSDVKSCYPYTLRYGGIPAVRQLRVVMEDGSGWYIFDLFPFRESSDEIVENLKNASAAGR